MFIKTCLIVSKIKHYGCKILLNLPQLWLSSGYRAKLELQELLFPQGIIYDREKGIYRTPEINDVVFAFSQLAKGFSGNEKPDFSKL